MSCTSSAAVTSSTSAAVFAGMPVEDVRRVGAHGADASGRVRGDRKYQVFHSGSTAWRTPSRMPCSVTTRFPPRRIGLAMRNQRMASEPSRSKTSVTSG